MFDTNGKKSDLPVYNSKLSPKRSNKGQTKKVAIGLAAFIVLWIIFFTDIGRLLQPYLTTPDDDFELYKATKHGVEKVDLSQSDLSDLAATPSSMGSVPTMSAEDQYKEVVEYYDLNQYRGVREGAEKGDVVLFLMPLRNAEAVLPMAFYNLMNLTYDHSLIDIAFLVSDCSPDDRTLETVFEYSVALQNGTLVDLLQQQDNEKAAKVKGSANNLYQLYMDPAYIESVKKAYLNNAESHHPGYRKPFRSVSIFKKDFGQIIGQGFSDRHAVKVQGIRRKLMGRARNWLTSASLKAYHSWVYWRDVDIETCPGNVIEQLMKHDYDIMVPNVWRPLPTFLGNEQEYDLNSWIESDPAIELAATLDEDDVIVEGYAEYPTWRAHLAYLRNPNGDPDEVVDLDGVGGVLILARASIFRQGVHFPAFTFLNHAETEAFGKMAKKMGFRVGGLPHYTIWHIYEPSEDDLQQIAKMERKKRRKGGR